MAYATDKVKSVPKQTIREKELWIDNDEGLYRWWKRTGKSKRNFIKENSDTLDELIYNAISQKPRDY